ncbi:type I polyketide synthase [Streptomyces chattanoogensis]|uniref:type I polyketide synthase n=1 Tax=Streptomyces chattanoogensis TaxID=66876 RepID=UPI0006B4E5E2|nr:type I polyketide synthase [Streptomyces chattanoogensis]
MTLNGEQNGESDRAVRTALKAVRGLRAKVEELTRARREPIALVGIGVRLPGGITTPADLHGALAKGVDAIGEVGSARWNHEEFYDPDPDAVGRTHMRHAGLIDGVDTFDAAFFGISPREAAHVDPQQRLLLEVAWEAFEDAGIPADRLAGSRAGVYVGANASDYLTMQLARPETVDLYTVVGGTNCIIANRLSYQLDLRGPSLSVDTACSSSLVAVHLAVQALRSGECDAAVAAGVNLLLSPASTVAHSKGLPLSPDGRCKTFDAAADGYVRGEGVLAVVLKRLSDAIAGQDRIYATIRGSAVNQDGRSNGLTAPSGRAQQDCITAALQNAGAGASQVSLVEAHGTGTSLGDPIEVEALAQIYGAEPGPICHLGSLKTNMGHLEAAAGIAGLVKAALAVHHRAVYPSLHLETVNPHLQTDGTRLGFAHGEVKPWDAEDEQRLAAVSAFGAGGTNAHVVIGPAPEPTPLPVEGAGAPHDAKEDGEALDEAPLTLRISAATPTALAELAGRYADVLDGTAPAHVRAVAAAADHRRTVLTSRLAASAASPAELVTLLREAAAGAPGPAAAVGSAKATGGTVFVFPGQGPHWVGMTARLRATSPAFAEAVREVDQAMRPVLGRSVLDLIEHGDEGQLPTRYVQPALFTISVGLVAMWRAAGVRPDAVIGHSMGEVAAAYVAGALSLPDAVTVICERSRLLARIAGQGRMLVVAVGHEQAQKLCEGYDDICVAVINSPHSTVLSGAPRSLERVAAALMKDKVFSRFVAVDVASHSPQIDALRTELLDALDGIRPAAPQLELVSTVTGASLTESAAPDYWYANMREPVRFAEGIRTLLAAGHDTFVEMSPHPTLVDALDGLCTEAGGSAASATWSLHRDLPDDVAVERAFGFMYTHRRRGPWPHRSNEEQDRVVPMLALPAYPFARVRHWFTKDQWANPWTGRAADTDTVTVAASDGPDIPQPESATNWTATQVTSTVVEAVAETLRVAPGALDPDAGFFALGMDSLLATRARNRLARTFGLTLPTRVMFEHPTATELAAYLVSVVCPDRQAREHAVNVPAGRAPDGPLSAVASELTDDGLIEALESALERTHQPTPGGRS